MSPSTEHAQTKQAAVRIEYKYGVRPPYAEPLPKIKDWLFI